MPEPTKSPSNRKYISFSDPTLSRMGIKKFALHILDGLQKDQQRLATEMLHAGTREIPELKKVLEFYKNRSDRSKYGRIMTRVYNKAEFAFIKFALLRTRLNNIQYNNIDVASLEGVDRKNLITNIRDFAALWVGFFYSIDEFTYYQFYRKDGIQNSIDIDLKVKQAKQDLQYTKKKLQPFELVLKDAIERFKEQGTKEAKKKWKRLKATNRKSTLPKGDDKAVLMKDIHLVAKVESHHVQGRAFVQAQANWIKGKIDFLPIINTLNRYTGYVIFYNQFLLAVNKDWSEEYWAGDYDFNHQELIDAAKSLAYAKRMPLVGVSWETAELPKNYYAYWVMTRKQYGYVQEMEDWQPMTFK